METRHLARKGRTLAKNNFSPSFGRRLKEGLFFFRSRPIQHNADTFWRKIKEKRCAASVIPV